MDIRGAFDGTSEKELCRNHDEVDWDELRKQANAINQNPHEYDELMDRLPETYAEPEYHSLRAPDLLE